jgi:hypothetical protein
MDPHELWQRPRYYGEPLDTEGMIEDVEQLRRALCQMTRDYTILKEELAMTKKCHGLDKKPFNFLQLPREVRDQIYRCALLAPIHVNTEPRPLFNLNLVASPYKPPNPHICLLNKQICEEANVILYSENTFWFEKAGQLLQFEHRISDVNKSLIRHIAFDVEYSSFSDVEVVHTSFIPFFDWTSLPSHWTKALRLSSCRNLDQMTITALVGSIEVIQTEDYTMHPDLKKAIVEILRRSQDDSKTTKLVLRRFLKPQSEAEKYPPGWDVRFGRYDAEIEWEWAMQVQFRMGYSSTREMEAFEEWYNQETLESC